MSPNYNFCLLLCILLNNTHDCFLAYLLSFFLSFFLNHYYPLIASRVLDCLLYFILVISSIDYIGFMYKTFRLFVQLIDLESYVYYSLSCRLTPCTQTFLKWIGNLSATFSQQCRNVFTMFIICSRNIDGIFLQQICDLFATFSLPFRNNAVTILQCLNNVAGTSYGTFLQHNHSFHFVTFLECCAVKVTRMFLERYEIV